MADLWSERQSLLDLPDTEALERICALRLRRREQRVAMAAEKKAKEQKVRPPKETTGQLLDKLSLTDIKRLLEMAGGDSDTEADVEPGDGGANAEGEFIIQDSES